MESKLRIELVAHIVNGYDRRDINKTFEENLFSLNRKGETERIRKLYSDKGFEVTEILLPDYGEVHSVTLDLQKLYNEATEVSIPGEERRKREQENCI
jgi:hypothetical protein